MFSFFGYSNSQLPASISPKLHPLPAGLGEFRTKLFNRNLRIAQLVERETVRVDLYLEVACSNQALEIFLFANCLIFIFWLISTEEPVWSLPWNDGVVHPTWNHHSKTCGVILQLLRRPCKENEILAECGVFAVGKVVHVAIFGWLSSESPCPRHNAVKPKSLSKRTLSMQLKTYVTSTTQATPPKLRELLRFEHANWQSIYCCYEAPDTHLHLVLFK